ncbi:hypothetical protein C461_11623 [Halorubrum aidingense JCM 13560]|uniref:Uncharacterized protein n=1 Tax=Halorubrum aidingense JCM 13560 TaxID=1230454 RepID=M0PA13_9EURY|nr:hypothetical protein [Halorubrum aidingense]EMA66688.1 hypothetical protein C461_11623 [Halorubrum aidingense JCM 13560]
MELSRREMLGGLGSACALGVVGFAGAASVTDDGPDGGGGGDAGDGAFGGDAGGSSGDGSADGGSVAADPDAPFEARLRREGDDDRRLFDASDLARVQGVISEESEHLVYVALGDDGVDAFQSRLADAGATDDPTGFAVSMTLDGIEVRRVELDDATVDALTDAEWGGVLTLPFQQASVAEDVYASLAADDA